MGAVDGEQIDFAFTISWARSRKSPVAPMAAPTRSRPCASLAALRYFSFFWMSLTVIRPFEVVVVVDHQQLLDAVFVQDILRLFESGAHGHGDQVFLGHHLADGNVGSGSRSAGRDW